MDYGLIWSCDRWQLRVQAAVSLGGVVTPADGGVATISTSWAPDLASVQTGFLLSAGRKGVQPRYIRLQIPALSVDTGTLYGSSGNGSIEALLEIDGLTVHLGGGQPPLWRVSWSAMRLYRDGTQVWSAGAGVYSDPLTCQRVAPSGVPLIGIPATLEASCQGLMPQAADCSIPTGSTDIYADAGPHTLTASGGWRFRETGTSAWVQLPVSLAMVSPPAPASCQCAVPSMAWPSATDTWTASCQAAVGGTGGTSFSGYRRACRVTLAPSLPRSIQRMTAGDYAALWVRGGFPQTAHLGEVAAHRCLGLNQPDPDCSSSETTVVHAPESWMLSTVAGTDAHAIEGPLAATAYAPYQSESYVYTMGPWPGECSVLRRVTYPVCSQSSSVLPALRHTGSDAALYTDTWLAPHWSYLYWFPTPVQDPDEPLHDWEWPVDGARVDTDDYWVTLRTQWLHHPALPEAEKRRTRTTLLSAPLLEGTLGQYIRDHYAAGATTSWVGVTRFAAHRPTPPASVTMDSSSAPAWSWSGGGATVTFGANVAVGGTGGTRTLELDVGRWDCKPWLYPQLASLVGLHWPATQVANVEVRLVGADGRHTVLHSGKNPPSGALAIPGWEQDKYAGSWAQDCGAGQVVDAGVDVRPEGESAARMSDPEQSGGWRYGASRSAAKLVFLIDPATPTGTVNLSYPVWYRSGQTPYTIAENGSQQAVLWANDAMVRLGQRIWRDPATGNVRQTPVASDGPGSAYGGGGYKPSALDALCDSRELWQAKDRLDGLETEIVSLWDSVERGGASSGSALWLQADERTWAWQHPATGLPIPTACLGTGWREVPPLATLPRRMRDSALLETGDWVQASYDWCTEPRYVATPAGLPLALKASDSAGDLLADVSGAPAGWVVRSHRMPVDNTESGYGLYSAGVRIATVRPWWGWTASPKVFAASGRSVYAVSRPLEHLWLADDGAVRKRSVTPNAGLPLIPPAQTVTLAAPTGGWSLAWHRRSALLAVSDGSVVDLYRSDDQGGSWSTVTTIGTGKHPAVVAAKTGRVHVYYVRSGAVYVRIGDPALGAWTAERATGISGLDDAPIDAAESVGPGGQWRIVLVGTLTGGALGQWATSDGVAFS